MIILAHYQATPLLAARRSGQIAAVTSPDLGRTTASVTLTDAGAVFPDGVAVAWADLDRIAATPNQCFVVEDAGIRSAQVFSTTTHWARSLMATPGAPTTLVAGFPMHRIQGIDPWTDTRRKLAAIAPIAGRVLDTATGLGYTAIQAAATATSVLTVERDPAALDIARLNPWSADLFANPRITSVIGDVAEVIQTLPDRHFARIIHDPPSFSLAGELYSGAFYAQLRRVVAPRGQVVHYIGDLESAAGRRIVGGVIRRLGTAGFRRVIRHPEAFGVVALPD